MNLKKIVLVTSILLFFVVACKEEKQIEKTTSDQVSAVNDSTTTKKKKTKDEPFELTDDNAIDFFFEYQKGLRENKVKVTTNHGVFTIELYDNVPYHKANFIYLTRQKYFDSTQFHRVVKNFIIQGGNSDDQRTADKRSRIGRYLLPPDTRKGHKHNRGTVSMPSSEINNPHMLASPFEFFIVVTKPGAYHLDGEYTPFGRVISGMNVVDEISNQAVGKGDWPSQNVYIEKMEVLE